MARNGYKIATIAPPVTFTNTTIPADVPLNGQPTNDTPIDFPNPPAEQKAFEIEDTTGGKPKSKRKYVRRKK